METSNRIVFEFDSVNVDMPASRFSQIIRSATSDDELATMAEDWLNSRLPDGYWVRVHVYSRDPIDYAVNIIQGDPATMPDNDVWWQREDFS